jgi:hypothetical protein
MIIYEITATVSDDLIEIYEKYMRETHILPVQAKIVTGFSITLTTKKC